MAKAVKKKDLKIWERLAADRPEPYAATFYDIHKFVDGVLPDADVERIGNSENLQIRNGGKTIVVSFSRSLLDDYEVVSHGQQPVPYSNGIRSDLHLQVYFALGIEGMIPGIRISDVLIGQERRDWLSRCRLEVRFDSEFTKGIYDGLCALQSSLLLTLRSEVALPEIEKELDVVKNLIEFHNGSGCLNCPNAERENLSYLKAAAICWILKLEEKKAREPSPRIKIAYKKNL